MIAEKPLTNEGIGLANASLCFKRYKTRRQYEQIGRRTVLCQWRAILCKR